MICDSANFIRLCIAGDLRLLTWHITYLHILDLKISRSFADSIRRLHLMRSHRKWEVWATPIQSKKHQNGLILNTLPPKSHYSKKRNPRSQQWMVAGSCLSLLNIGIAEYYGIWIMLWYVHFKDSIPRTIDWMTFSQQWILNIKKPLWMLCSILQIHLLYFVTACIIEPIYKHAKEKGNGAFSSLNWQCSATSTDRSSSWIAQLDLLLMFWNSKLPRKPLSQLQQHDTLHHNAFLACVNLRYRNHYCMSWLRPLVWIHQSQLIATSFWSGETISKGSQDFTSNRMKVW